MDWWWRRGAKVVTPGQPSGERVTTEYAASSAPRAGDSWAELPALQRSFENITPAAPLDRFTEGLSAHRHLGILGPMEHLVHPGAPSGLVEGLAAPAPPIRVPGGGNLVLPPPRHRSTPAPGRASFLQRIANSLTEPASSPPAEPPVVQHHPDPGVEASISSVDDLPAASSPDPALMAIPEPRRLVPSPGVSPALGAKLPAPTPRPLPVVSRTPTSSSTTGPTDAVSGSFDLEPPLQFGTPGDPGAGAQTQTENLIPTGEGVSHASGSQQRSNPLGSPPLSLHRSEPTDHPAVPGEPSAHPPLAVDRVVVDAGAQASPLEPHSKASESAMHSPPTEAGATPSTRHVASGRDVVQLTPSGSAPQPTQMPTPSVARPTVKTPESSTSSIAIPPPPTMPTPQAPATASSSPEFEFEFAEPSDAPVPPPPSATWVQLQPSPSVAAVPGTGIETTSAPRAATQPPTPPLRQVQRSIVVPAVEPPPAHTPTSERATTPIPIQRADRADAQQTHTANRPLPQATGTRELHPGFLPGQAAQHHADHTVVDLTVDDAISASPAPTRSDAAGDATASDNGSTRASMGAALRSVAQQSLVQRSVAQRSDAPRPSSHHAPTMLPLAQMFSSAPKTAAAASHEAASAERVLPGPTLQRQSSESLPTLQSEPPPPLEQPGAEVASLPETADASSTGPEGVAPASAAPGVDIEDLARRLFEPLSAQLRSELWLDRERAGLMIELRR